MSVHTSTVPGALPAVAAMIAFAANSVLCRLALGAGLIDAASFTSVRLLSGSACLIFIVMLRDRHWRPAKPDWLAVLSLSAYMLCFSFAYQSLSTGTGALLLFGCVQLTMIGTALYRGERFSAFAWLGLIVAASGLVFLVSPGVSAPDPVYSLLMAIAGLAWGSYSLSGIRGNDPTSATTNNFLYATPIALVVSASTISDLHYSSAGLALAIASGTMASALGYAIWYAALTHLKASSAAILQLSVPAIATLGGILFLAEPLTPRIAIAALLTLGGIALFLTPKTTTTAD